MVGQVCHRRLRPLKAARVSMAGQVCPHRLQANRSMVGQVCPHRLQAEMSKATSTRQRPAPGLDRLELGRRLDGLKLQALAGF